MQCACHLLNIDLRSLIHAVRVGPRNVYFFFLSWVKKEMSHPLSAGFTCSQTLRTVDVVFRIKNAKMPVVTVHDKSAEVRFGKEVTNVPFVDKVDASSSIQLSSHNVVISFRKRDHNIWDVLPGAAAKKKKKSKGEEEHSNSQSTSPSPCTPSGDAASSELYLGGKKEAADPTSKAPKNRKVVVIEEESEEEENSTQALMQRKSGKSADTEFSEAAPTKSVATSRTRVLIEELVGSEEEEDDLQKTANDLGPPKADRAHNSDRANNSNGKQASKGKASDVVAAEKSSDNEEKVRKNKEFL